MMWYMLSIQKQTIIQIHPTIHYILIMLKPTKKEETSFLQMPEELKTRIFYMLSINPENGDFYVGTTDYNTNGDIYRFKKDGTFIEKFESGGVSPRAAVFID